MCLHYLVKLIARVWSPYITNMPCFVQKATFHNSLNVKMFTYTYKKCWFADVILFGVTVCKVIMHSCNNTVASGVTVHVQTVLLQQQHTLTVVFATHSLHRQQCADRDVPTRPRCAGEVLQHLQSSPCCRPSPAWFPISANKSETIRENLMPKVHNLYVRRQNSCDKFYKIV